MKSVRLFLIVCCLAAALTACSTGATDNVAASPSPSAKASATAAPAEAVLPQPTSNFDAQSDTFIAVGDKAVITVGTTKLSGTAYYHGNDKNNMLLPFVEVCKALGWKAEEAAGTGEIRLTQDGMDAVTVKMTVPEKDAPVKLQGVTAVRGEKTVNPQGETFAWIDGQLYATEKFISACVQEIDVEYDGANAVAISTKV